MAQVSCSILARLRHRGVLKDATTASLTTLLAAGGSPAAYAGFDPTARSLHVGNLSVMVALRQLQAVGFQPVWLVSAEWINFRISQLANTTNSYSWEA